MLQRCAWKSDPPVFSRLVRETFFEFFMSFRLSLILNVGKSAVGRCRMLTEPCPGTKRKEPWERCAARPSEMRRGRRRLRPPSAGSSPPRPGTRRRERSRGHAAARAGRGPRGVTEAASWLHAAPPKIRQQGSTSVFVLRDFGQIKCGDRKDQTLGFFKCYRVFVDGNK